jgi:hypothetical protein
MISLALELTRPCPVSTHILAIVTTVGSSSIPGWSGSYGIGDFFVRRGFRAVFGVVPVSAAPSGSGVDPGLRSSSGVGAFREAFFLRVRFAAAGCWDRRALLDGELVGLDSGSTADAGRFFSGVDGGRGSGGGVCNPRAVSLSVVRVGSSMRGRSDSVGGWTSVEREGTKIGLGVGEGRGMDEERDPMLMGVAGLLEDPTAIGVDTLVKTMFGMTR